MLSSAVHTSSSVLSLTCSIIQWHGFWTVLLFIKKQIQAEVSTVNRFQKVHQAATHTHTHRTHLTFIMGVMVNFRNDINVFVCVYRTCKPCEKPVYHDVIWQLFQRDSFYTRSNGLSICSDTMRVSDERLISTQARLAPSAICDVYPKHGLPLINTSFILFIFLFINLL